MKPLFANLFGPPGTGKTTTGFTFPPPFHYARFDRRADAIIKSVKAKFGPNSVLEVPLIGDLNFLTDRQAENHRFLGEMEKLVDGALKLNEGTFFVDGGHRWWEVVQACKLPDLDNPSLTDQQRGALERKRRMTYGIANSYLDSIMLTLENSNLQIVITHHTKPTFDSKGEETGDVTPDYFKRVPYTATLEVFMISSRKTGINLLTAQAAAMQLQQSPQMKKVLPAPEFFGLVSVCKDDASVEGTMIPNPTFPLLYGLALSTPWPGDCWSLP